MQFSNVREQKQASRSGKNSLQSEYVVGGNSYFSSEVLSPSLRNRVQPELNANSTELLKVDSEVSSSVEFLIDSVFGDGLQIYPCVPEEDADCEKAREIADFMRPAVACARRPVVSVLREQFRGTYYSGVKVAEIVLRYEDNNRFQNKYVLDRINLKPNNATAFITDKFKNVLGLVGAKRPRYSFSGSRIALNSDEMIERRKFLIFAFELE